MKRAVILHGTDGAPTHNWFPWLKEKLEATGYEVWVPLLPNNHTPNRHSYNDLLLSGEWDFTDNVVIGHSSGAVSVLNLLADDRCPKISTGILIGAWAKIEGTDLEYEQFKDLFPEQGFDFNKISTKANELIYVHGDNDPFCPLEQAKCLAEQTKSEIVIIPKGGHLGSGFTELPVVVDILTERNLL